MKSITVTDTKGHMGRTYVAGKHYRVVKDPPQGEHKDFADDEVPAAHARTMVASGMAVERKLRPAKAKARDVKPAKNRKGSATRARKPEPKPEAAEKAAAAEDAEKT